MKYPTQIYKELEYRLYSGERYFSRGAKRLHRVVWEDNNGPIPRGKHIHHLDQDPYNNAIDNLELKDAHAHLSEHMTPSRRVRARHHAEQIRPLTKEWHQSEAGRAWHREHAKIAYKKRKPVERNCAHCGTPFKTLQLATQARFCHANCKMKARRRRMKGLPESAPLA